MRIAKKKGGAARPAPPLDAARLLKRVIAPYPQLARSSNELAECLIGERFRLSPAVARTVVELVGYGKRA